MQAVRCFSCEVDVPQGSVIVQVYAKGDPGDAPFEAMTQVRALHEASELLIAQHVPHHEGGEAA